MSRKYGSAIIVQLLQLAVVLLVWSCANPVAPTGGPKDVTPPEVVASQPENGLKNFRGNQIQLTFSEYVQVKNVNEQVIISPP
ncbi:MAG TPA: Ig-like domain-containing protein, partial [Bacteroidales bacterium]|nr:Ig-like domain-containing protein [Bacteroidales bacterium]